jgi:hypothetical protein
MVGGRLVAAVVVLPRSDLQLVAALLLPRGQKRPLVELLLLVQLLLVV